MSSEMEAIWLATANSDLRSEQRELKAKIERLGAENFRLVTEIERLERWKTDATYVINAWEEAWESAAVPDNLGATKSEAMLDEITRLRDEVDIKECRVEGLSNQIEQLRAELDAVTDLRSQMTIILHRIGVALYGEEPDIGWWSWHDLPERAAAERAEIKRLRAEVRGFQAESGCWQRWHDAERALADQLAVAVQGLRQAAIIGIYRPSEELAAAHSAVAAYAAARTNGSASATDVGGQP